MRSYNSYTMKTTLILIYLLLHILTAETNIQTNKQKNSITKPDFLHIFFSHIQQEILAITVFLYLFYSHLLVLTHFILLRILSHSTNQTSSCLSFSGGEYEKNQISPMHLFETVNNCPFPEKVIIQVVIPVSL